MCLRVGEGVGGKGFIKKKHKPPRCVEAPDLICTCRIDKKKKTRMGINKKTHVSDLGGGVTIDDSTAECKKVALCSSLSCPTAIFTS